MNNPLLGENVGGGMRKQAGSLSSAISLMRLRKYEHECRLQARATDDPALQIEFSALADAMMKSINELETALG